MNKRCGDASSNGRGDTPPVILRVTLLILVLAVPAHADGRLLADDTFEVHEPSAILIDGGLITGMPAALGRGMSSGVGAGITHACGCNLAYGVRASWSTATESSESWLVTHQDVRLRAIGELRHVSGRGTIALRLGAGATIVHENRRLSQLRPGIDEHESRAFDTLPAADLEAVVALQIAGSWDLVVNGGPSVDYFQNALHAGWIAELGVGWQL